MKEDYNTIYRVGDNINLNGRKAEILEIEARNQPNGTPVSSWSTVRVRVSNRETRVTIPVSKIDIIYYEGELALGERKA